MSRAAYNLEFFPRRRSGFKDAGFAMEQFRQVITGDCFVYSKHTSHLFLMLDFDPQSPDHTSVTFTEPLLCADAKSLSRSQNSFFLRSNRIDCCSLFGEAPEVPVARWQLHSPCLSMPVAGGSVSVNLQVGPTRILPLTSR